VTRTAHNLRACLLPAAAVVATAILIGTPATRLLAENTVSIPHFDEKQLPQPVTGLTGAAAVTVFVDRGPEKVKAAELLTKLHAAMAVRGYTFADLEPYEENADLEGWRVTYVAR
jgi:hypothetical protein